MDKCMVEWMDKCMHEWMDMCMEEWSELIVGFELVSSMFCVLDHKF